MYVRFLGIISLLCSLVYVTARRALLIIAAIQPDCFEIVVTRMLVSVSRSTGWSREFDNVRRAPDFLY